MHSTLSESETEDTMVLGVRFRSIPYALTSNPDCLHMETARMALSESPPRRMKSSSIPILSTPSASENASQRIFSVSFLGGTYSYLREERSGFGRALLSTFPFTLRGMESNWTTKAGTM